MRRRPHAASQLLHKALATASGAAGGAFGLAALPFELPVSTIIMLRSIADIARSTITATAKRPLLAKVPDRGLLGRASSWGSPAYDVA
jgi:hypothetical protein